VNFEEYLISKKIDSKAFQEAEENLWTSWKDEFDQVHPNSFTMQKLNLINPIRRKYQLKEQKKIVAVTSDPEIKTESKLTDDTQATATRPTALKPVFRPKPKMN
jgi:hypothetical protein